MIKVRASDEYEIESLQITSGATKNRERLAGLVLLALFVVGALTITVSIGEWWTGGPLAPDATDAPHQHSGLSMKTDFGTGCEYLVVLGGITPRLGRDGKQICEAHHD